MVVRKLLVLSLCFLKGSSEKLCGIAESASEKVYEGRSNIEKYPWIGFLFYRYDSELYTTAVVLVSRQIVLATAAEIDALPKVHFRSHARVVLGHTCPGNSIGIREYTYHPDYFESSTITTICVIQLETDVNYDGILRPICSPPQHFSQPIFYAMVPSNSCLKSTVMIYKMVFVPLEQCKTYYRRNGLDVKSFWPSETVCAKSMTEGDCVWRSGAVLTVKTGNRWRLLGFGVYGPGCRAPARFLDYGFYQKWVRRSVARIGRPSITILDSNLLVMRRMSSNVQRFGTCDYEETLLQLYTDRVTVTRALTEELANVSAGLFKYNISLFENVDYSCIIFQARNFNPTDQTTPKPFIRLRQWCSGDKVFCSGNGLLSIHFYVEVSFISRIWFDVQIYGTEAKIIHVGAAIMYINTLQQAPILYNLTEIHKIMKKTSYMTEWFMPTFPPRLRTGSNITKPPGKMLDRTLHIKRPVNRPRYPITTRLPYDGPLVITSERNLNWEREPKVVTETYRHSQKTIFDIDWDADTYIDDQISGSSGHFVVTAKPINTVVTTKRPHISIKRPLVTYSRPIELADVKKIKRPIIRPVVTTEKLTVITERPFITTRIPRRTTKSSLITKEGPLITYVKPVRTTETSVLITQRPIINRKRPVRPTKRPSRTTKKPVRTTKKPVKATKKPVRSTKKPVRTTKKPVRTTIKPVRTTKKPVRTKKKPVRTTKKPFRTTKKPVRTAKKPVRTTIKPDRSTKKFVRTKTRPYITTKRPIIITKKPVFSTRKPVRTSKKLVRTRKKPIRTSKRPVKTSTPVTTTEEPVNTEGNFVFEIPFVTPGKVPYRTTEKPADVPESSPEYHI